MNTILRMYNGETTFTQDVIFIFGIAAIIAGWFAIYAGREPWGTPFGLRFFAPVWIMDAPRHWICYQRPHWWATLILAIAIAVWVWFAYFLQIIAPGILGFKATSFKEIPTPLVWHKHRAAALAFHAFQWFAGNIALSALARGIMPHSHLAILFNDAITKTFAKLEMNARTSQTSFNQIEFSYRAPVTYNEIVQLKSKIAAVMGCGLDIRKISIKKPGTLEVNFGWSQPTINNYQASHETEPDQVYFITYTLDDMQVVKIGRSNSPTNTLRTCRRFVPSAKLVGALPFSNVVSETKIHAMFQAERIEHESGERDSEVFAMSPRIKRYLTTVNPSYK